MFEEREKLWVILIGCALLLASTVMPVQAATMGSHYPFGGEGVTAGSAPPPGFHYRGYLTLTNPTTYKDDNGDDLPVDVNVDVVATVHRFLHVTKFQILGANYAYEVVVPIVETVT